MLDTLRDKVKRGERISVSEAAWLHEHAPDAELQTLANLVRDRFHPPRQATWLIMAIVNYTNVCVAKCDYCAFYRLPKQEGTYLLSRSELFERIDACLALGGAMVGFNGGFHPDLRLEDYVDIFNDVRARYGEALEFYGMTVAEFMFACKVSKLSYDEGARLMASSGNRWVTGGGAEILTDSFRKRHSPLKYMTEDYYDAQRAIVQAGLGSTATMVIGFDETLDERMAHLDRLRRFQDDMGGALPSFLVWTYKPWNTELGGEETSERDYLRWLAICRLFLDNIPHIRTSVLTRNTGALRGLAWGADDFDLPTEDEVTQTAGATISHDFQRLLQAARDEGFQPVQRAPWPRGTADRAA